MRNHLLFAMSFALISSANVKAQLIKVACVGDSITFGAGVTVEANRYPTRLGVLLGKGYEVRNFGASGTTMLDDGDFPYKKSDQFLKAIAFIPDVVVIKLGTNDSKPQNISKIVGFYASSMSLVERFQSLNPNITILLAYPAPVIGEGNFDINNEGVKGKIIPLIGQVATEKKIRIIDLYRALFGQEALFPDRVHPNDEGAEVIARAVFEAITKNKSP